MQIRLAQLTDADKVLDIIEINKMYLKSMNIDQWQNGYPNINSIHDDINLKQCFVLEENEEIIGTAAIITGIEETYNNIYNGKWLTDIDNYVTIHRIAISPNYKGRNLAYKFIEYCVDNYSKCTSIRIDTHKDNLSMQKFLSNSGFTHCGDIYLEDGNHRYGYELVF